MGNRHDRTCGDDRGWQQVAAGGRDLARGFDGAMFFMIGLNQQVIDTFACAGTVDDVIGALREFVAAGIDLPLAWHTLGPDRDRALELLAGPVRAAL